MEKESGCGLKRGSRETQVGKAAWLALKAHGVQIALLMLCQVLIRLLVLLPLIFWLGEASFAYLSGWGWCIAAALGYVFAVLPLRFYAGECFRQYSAPHLARPSRKIPYAVFLRCGLMRFGRGVLWGLPFLGGMIFFLYGMEYLPFNTMGGHIQQFATLLGGEPTLDKGLFVFFALLLIFGVIFALGWWRDLPMEYLPARRLGARGVNQYAQKVRARAQGRMGKNMLQNLLLSLPALLGAIAVLLPYILNNIRFTSNKLMLLQGVLRLIKSPLPGTQLVLLGLVFLLLYLPLCALRKMRNAVLVRRLSRELNEREDGHAAG